MNVHTPPLSGAQQRLLQLLLGKPAAAERGSPRPAEQTGPLSIGQLRLLFVELMQPGSAVYNTECLYELRGRLEPAALCAAIERMVARQECLRSRVDMHGEEPRMAVDDAGLFEVVRLDVRHLPDDSRHLAVRRACGVPFDLQRGPLFRATLFHLAQDVHVLALCMHHIVSDGWSLAVMAREISEGYDAVVNKRAPRLPPLALTYRQFAARERVESQRTTPGSIDYWHRQLAGAQAVRFPTSTVGARTPAMRRGRGINTALDAALVSAVRDLARRANASPFMVYAAAFLAVLARHSGQTDVTLGTPVGTRQDADCELLIGLFLNTLALRFQWAGTPTFLGLLRDVRNTALDGFEHQAVPFNKIADILAAQPAASAGFPMNCMFVLQNTAPAELELTGIDSFQHDLPAEAALFDVLLQIEDTEHTIASLQYDIALFDEAAAIGMLDDYVAFLRAAVADGDAGLGVLWARADATLGRMGHAAVAPHLAHWLGELAGLPPGPCATTAQGKTSICTEHLDAATTARLAALGGADVPLFSVVHAAFALMLAHFTGVDDLVIGMPAADLPDAGTTAAPLLPANLVPLRTRIVRQDRFLDFLAAVRSTERGAATHLDVPIELLSLRLKAARDGRLLTVAPMVMRRGAAAAGVGSRTDRTPRAKRVEPLLSLEVRESSQQLTLRFEANAACFDAAFLERLASSVGGLLRAVATDGTRSLTSYLPAAARTLPISVSTTPACSAAPSDLPGTALQRLIHATWAEFLEGPFGIDDDFFVLGGDRTMASAMLARLGERLPVSLSLQRFWAGPSVRATERALAEMCGGDAVEEIARIVELVQSLPDDAVATMLDDHRL